MGYQLEGQKKDRITQTARVAQSHGAFSLFLSRKNTAEGGSAIRFPRDSLTNHLALCWNSIIFNSMYCSRARFFTT